LIAALIAIALVASFQAVEGGLAGVFTRITNALTAAG
jgi:Flp pilus assembly pilin Flp